MFIAKQTRLTENQSSEVCDTPLQATIDLLIKACSSEKRYWVNTLSKYEDQPLDQQYIKAKEILLDIFGSKASLIEI
jgi:hypothetical protein